MWKLQCGFLWTIPVVQTREIYIYIQYYFFCVWERWGQGCCLWQSGKLMSNRFYGLYFTCSATLNCWNVSVQAMWSSVCNLFCGSRNTYIFFKPLSHFGIFECPVFPSELRLRCICLLRWFMVCCPFSLPLVQNVNWNSRTGKASSSAKSAGDKILKKWLQVKSHFQGAYGRVENMLSL